MNDRAWLLLAVIAVTIPASAFAGAPITQAGVVAKEPAKFDGASQRNDANPVLAGGGADKRTKEQIAKDEQVKADARSRGNLAVRTYGEDKEIQPPKPNTWITKPLIQRAFCGALIGLLIGSLFGPIGLIAGPLIGAALFYGMAKYDAVKAAAADAE